MVTQEQKVHWAEAFLQNYEGDLRAALVRENELFVREWVAFHGEPNDFIVVLYQFVPSGTTLPEDLVDYRGVEVPGQGIVYQTFAWMEDMWSGDRYSEVRRELELAETKLSFSSYLSERRQKVIELVKWSVRAASGDLFDLDN